MKTNVLNNEVAVRRQRRLSVYKNTSKIKFLMFVVTIIIAMMAATQWFAHSYNYHSALGEHLNKIYWPWKIFDWYITMPDLNQQFYQQSIGAFVIVCAIGFISILIYQTILANSTKDDPFLHGSAEWARDEDVFKSGLVPIYKKGKKIGGDGVYVGAYVDSKGKQHYLRHNGPEHILTYAPSRSGKGVGLIIPTLLTWTDSVVITDLKGELWSLTAGWRKEYAKQKVLRFEPASSQYSVKWNPLEEIRLGTEYEVGDVQNLATLIVDPDGKGLVDHWQKTSQSLLVGLILHVLYMQNTDDSISATMSGIDKLLSDPNRNVKKLWGEMLDAKHIDGTTTHPVVSASARDMLDRPDEEAGSVLSTLKSYLQLYRDPVVANNTAYSEFSIKDIMNHTDPVSLYIITQPNDKTRLRPIVRVMINMIVRLLASEMKFEKGRPVANYKHRLLLLLDEFPSLGKLEIIEESLAFVAGYGIKCYLICQDLTQLRDRNSGYGEQEKITSNCHIQNAYAPNRVETAEYLSKQTGITTITKEQITTSGKRTALMHGNATRTTQATQRPLMTADEMMRMPAPVKDPVTRLITEPGDMVIFVAGMSPIYGRQPLYFQDPVFQARSEVEAPKETDKLKAKKEIQADERVSI